MEQSNSIQTNFTAGRMSPRLLGRTDIAKYYNGVSDLRNMIVQQHGGTIRRSGTKYVAEVRDSTDLTRLVEFKFSVTQTYAIEFGEQYVRFYTNRSQLTVSPSVSAGSRTGSGPWTATLTIGTHTMLVGTEIVVADVTSAGPGTYNGTYTISAVAATTVSYSITAADPGTYTTAGTVTAPYEIASPYTAAQLADIKYTQSADILFLNHPTVRPQELQRLSATSWQFVEFDFQDGPYDAINTGTTTLTLSGTTGSVTVTASAIAGINSDTGFQTTDVDRLIRWQDPANNWTWLEITARASTTSVTATIRGADASAGTATISWRLGAWSDTDGWPWVPVFNQNRMWHGGSNKTPDTFWSSETANFIGFRPSSVAGTVLDTDGVSATISDNQVNAIYWMASGARGLLIGTAGGEFAAQNRAAFDPITPSNIAVSRQTKYGSIGTVRQEQSGSGIILFLQKAGRKIREMVFNFDIDQFTAPDLSILSEDITVGGLTDMAYQQEPNSLLWSVRADGSLICTTYERDQEVIAWGEHVVGGVFGSTQAVVESIASIPDDSGSKVVDQLWMIVKRTVNGGTVRYVEYMEDQFDTNDDQTDAYFVDSGITYSGGATSTITGLDHLEGETISVLADGAAHPDVVVASGQVTLQVSATKVHAGLAADAWVGTLPITLQHGQPDTRLKIRRIEKAHIMFHQTLGAKVGPSLTELETIPFREGNAPLTSPPPLFTGTKEDIHIESKHEREQKIYVVQDQPLPMTILSIIMELHIAKRK